MEKLLLFAGTSEGRKLAEYLLLHQAACTVCTATEYGETLLPKGDSLEHISERLDVDQMCELMKNRQITLVIDSTHPHAKIVTENIREAADRAGVPVLRLVRPQGEIEGDLVTVPSVSAAVEYLSHTEGHIFAATGSKELKAYTALPDYKERVTARVLSMAGVAAQCRELGFEGKNLICMQGPFSEELNYAMLKQTGAKYLVTKESGAAGGLEEKIRAAKRAGAKLVVIGRPVQEEGYTLPEMKKELASRMGFSFRGCISMVGIGPGDKNKLTVEAKNAIEGAEALIGAGRMLEAFDDRTRPVFSSYRSEEMADFIEAHPEFSKIAVLFSGDVGFYSGASSLEAVIRKRESLKRAEAVRLPGISSLVEFCAKLSIPWEDVKMVSVHGRNQNLTGAIASNPKVFAIVGKGGVTDCARELDAFGMGSVKLYVGENLSYKEEKITVGTAKELSAVEFAGLSVLLAVNPDYDTKVGSGIRDEAFLRTMGEGKKTVPMTKEEIRSISLSRMDLTRDAIVYDVGAGTGSVSVEAALLAKDGQVFAIEKNPAALDLLKQNRIRFHVPNMTVVEGLAPEALKELPAPTHVFIGGSSGNMKEILRLLLDKNPKVRIVINAIALETLAETLTCLKELPVSDVLYSCVSAARSRTLGRYTMMMGQNPVYIISCQGGMNDEG